MAIDRPEAAIRDDDVDVRQESGEGHVLLDNGVRRRIPELAGSGPPVVATTKRSRPESPFKQGTRRSVGSVAIVPWVTRTTCFASESLGHQLGWFRTPLAPPAKGRRQSGPGEGDPNTGTRSHADRAGCAGTEKGRSRVPGSAPEEGRARLGPLGRLRHRSKHVPRLTRRRALLRRWPVHPPRGPVPSRRGRRPCSGR